MIAWINFMVMIVSALLFLYFYVKSVGPAAMEGKVGEIAYSKCTRYRQVASLFEIVDFVNYAIYSLYPLPVPLPTKFPWSRLISGLIAVLIAIPGGYLLGRGLKDAGEESFFVKKQHTLHGGIYKRMRHPQAVGEVTFWWVTAFLLNSPFLALFSFVWIPVFYVMCWAEEKDLIIRYGEEYLKYKTDTGFIIPKRKKK